MHLVRRRHPLPSPALVAALLLTGAASASASILYCNLAHKDRLPVSSEMPSGPHAVHGEAPIRRALLDWARELEKALLTGKPIAPLAEILAQVDASVHDGLLSPMQGRDIARSRGAQEAGLKYLGALTSNRRGLEEYLDSVYDGLVAKSDALKREAREKGYLLGDFGLLGAGWMSAAFGQGYHYENPTGRLITFEASKSFGNFDRNGEVSAVNSAEYEGVTRNSVYGSAVQIRDINFEGDQFVMFRRFGQMTRIAHELAETNVVLETAGVDIYLEPAGAGWPGPVKVVGHNGITAYYPGLGMGSGLGEPILPFEDATSIAYAKSEMKKPLPKYEPSDGVWKRLNDAADESRLRRENPSATMAQIHQLRRAAIYRVLEPYRGKKIIYTGKGDSALITFFPELMDIVGEIIWLGQSAENFRAYVASDPRLRYRQFVQRAYESGKLRVIDARSFGIRSSGDGVRVLARDSRTGARVEVEADYNWSFTGYKSVMLDRIHVDGQKELRRVSGDLDDLSVEKYTQDTFVAYQVYVDGVAIPVYTFELANGLKELSKEEWQLMGSFVGAMGRKTQAFGEMMGESSTATDIRAQLMPGVTRVRPVTPPMKSPRVSPLAARVKALMSLTRTLRDYHFNGRGQVRIEISKSPGSYYRMKVTGADPATADGIIARLGDSSGLAYEIENWLSAPNLPYATKWVAEIELPVTDTGDFQLDELTLKARLL